MKNNLKNKKITLKNVKSNKVALLVVCSLILAVSFMYLQRSKMTHKDPGFQPLVEYTKELEIYHNECPLDGLFWESQKNKSSYEIVDLKCSANEDAEFKANTKGEDIKVEIYTQNFEEGKRMFRDWLESHGLSESEKLRVQYQHSPR